MTYRRAIDSVKIHVGPNGAFAAFGADDEIIGEGKDADDLRFIVNLRSLAIQYAERDGPVGKANRQSLKLST